MVAEDFRTWLRRLRVLVATPDVESKHALWASEAGATVTRIAALSEAVGLPQDLDAAVVDAGMDGSSELLDLLPAACGVVIVAGEPMAELYELADRKHAAIVMRDTPRVDFLFEMRRAATLQVPDISYLVGHAEQLWNLPPRQSRVLFYNLWSHSDREIAEAIGISVHTVQEHQNGLRRRTGVRTKYGYLRRLAETAGMRPPLD